MKFPSRKRFLGFGLIGPLFFLSGCLNLGPTGGHRAQFLVTLTSLSPSTVTAGGPPFLLTVNGTNLTGGIATLVWNGSQRISSVGGGTSTESTQATFSIDAALIANPGSISIAVVDGINANQLSNALTLTISPRTTTACSLFGLYHFVANGFDTKNGSIVESGAFGIDADGNVTGEFMLNNPFGSTSFGDTGGVQGMTGQCTNSATPNQGNLTITCPACGALGAITFTYTYVLQQAEGGQQHGRLVESNDSVNTFGSVSAAGLFVQVIPDSVFNGDYAFGAVGGDDLAGAQIAIVGRFTWSNGNLSGVIDINDGGTVLNSLPLSGPAPNSSPFTLDAYSVGNLGVTIGAQQGRLTFFETSPSSGFVVGTLPSPSPNLPPGTPEGVTLGGIVSSQANAGAYDNGSLNAPLVISTVGVHPLSFANAMTDTTLGLASGFNSGAGTFNLLLDNVSSGASDLNQNGTGATYSVASNGRATVSYTLAGNTRNYVYYLDGPNDGYILGLGNSAEFGFFQPQAPGPFTTAALNGTFASATFLPLTPASPNVATQITLANGNLSANTPAGALTGTYTIAPSGRGTATVNLPVLGGKNLLFYVISPNSVAVMGSDSTTSDAITFMHF